jgi:hypothetical protein|nr:hypothetical protein [Acetobacterium sp. KB-1]
MKKIPANNAVNHSNRNPKAGIKSFALKTVEGFGGKPTNHKSNENPIIPRFALNVEKPLKAMETLNASFAVMTVISNIDLEKGQVINDKRTVGARKELSHFDEYFKSIVD